MNRVDAAWAVGRLTLSPLVQIFARLRSYGEERMPLEGGLVLALNHFSWIDPAAFGSTCPRTIHYLAKVEAHRVPGLGQLIRDAGGRLDPSIRRACPVLDGYDKRLLEWIADSGLAAIAADNLAVERSSTLGADPRLPHRGPALPLHEHCLFKLGIHLGEPWYLTELAAWLREHHRSSFLLTAPPLRLPGAAGSPVTPVATV